MDALEADLRDLAAKKAAQSPAGIIKRVHPLIQEALALGASHREIVNVLLNHNVRVTTAHLKTTLTQLSHEINQVGDELAHKKRAPLQARPAIPSTPQPVPNRKTSVSASPHQLPSVVEMPKKILSATLENSNMRSENNFPPSVEQTTREVYGENDSNYEDDLFNLPE